MKITCATVTLPSSGGGRKRMGVMQVEMEGGREKREGRVRVREGRGMGIMKK